MAFGLPIRWRRITHGSAASWDVFLHTQNQLYNLPLQNLYRRHMHKRHVTLEQKTRRRKNVSLNRVFHKLDNNKRKMHTGARAKEQKYISIYISLCMKTPSTSPTPTFLYILKDISTSVGSWLPVFVRTHPKLVFMWHKGRIFELFRATVD